MSSARRLVKNLAHRAIFSGPSGRSSSRPTAVDAGDIRSLPLRTRKIAFRRIMPGIENRLRYLDHIESRGVDQFTAACERDLECGTNLPGVVSRVRLRTWTDTSQEGERSSLEITLRAASQVRSGAEQQGRPANQHPRVGSQFAAIQLVD